MFHLKFPSVPVTPVKFLDQPFFLYDSPKQQTRNWSQNKVKNRTLKSKIHMHCSSAHIMIFFSFLILYITQWTSAKEKFDLDRIKISFRSFKNVQICRHFGPPFAPVLPSFWMSCDVDYGTCDIRLDSSRLFYLCKFSLVVHTKCWKGAFCMDYEAKFTEVKQAM